MLLVIFPAVEPARLRRIEQAVPSFMVVNADSEEAALAAIVEADALFGRITPRLLSAARKLRWVQSSTASLEHYLFPELVEHPCVLTNMRGIFSDIVANHVLGYLLCFSRNLHHYLRQQARRQWAAYGGEASPTPKWGEAGEVTDVDRAHRDLAGATIGIVGYGGIGRAVARLAQAFEMLPVAVDRVAAPTVVDEVPCSPVEALDALLAQSDYVVLCAPHTPRTAHLIGREQLERMKREAILINVGRGALVDLAALTEALAEKRIAGAALDVFEIEPLPAEHPLWSFENVILTPHIGARSPQIADRHLQVLLRNLKLFADGQPLENVVDKREWC
ncbi:MAG: D-2-hydroxyacid dehydrogenase [Planctomycetes bacterium]|nr:D-2-hydroxyacid dehydrogenase [Planctomycetota bacterium]